VHLPLAEAAVQREEPVVQRERNAVVGGPEVGGDGARVEAQQRVHRMPFVVDEDLARQLRRAQIRAHGHGAREQRPPCRNSGVTLLVRPHGAPAAGERHRSGNLGGVVRHVPFTSRVAARPR